MAGFTTYDSIINAITVGSKLDLRPFTKMSAVTVANAFSSSWFVSGWPQGTYGAGGSARVCDMNTTGAIFFDLPTGANTKHFLSVGAQATVAVGNLLLVDRLLDYGARVGSNLAFTLNNGVSLTRYTDGKGVMVFVETVAATGATAGSLQLNYTNSAGSSGRVTGSVAMTASSILYRLPHTNTGFFMPLQGTDQGVRSVQSMQFSANVGGSVCIVLCKPIINIPILVANSWQERDMVLQLPNMLQIQNSGCYMWLYNSNTTSTGNIYGHLLASEN